VYVEPADGDAAAAVPEDPLHPARASTSPHPRTAASVTEAARDEERHDCVSKTDFEGYGAAIPYGNAVFVRLPTRIAVIFASEAKLSPGELLQTRSAVLCSEPLVAVY